MSRIYSQIFFDNEVNLRSAVIREDISVANAITVSNATLTSQTIATVSNTQMLIQTINETSASDPALGIRYDALVVDSGQPDVSNIAANVVAHALLGYAQSNVSSDINSSQIVVANLVANAAEVLTLSSDDIIVSNIDATIIEAGSITADHLNSAQAQFSELTANVLTMDPYVFLTTSNGFALCHKSNITSQQQPLDAYRVLAIFTDDCEP